MQLPLPAGSHKSPSKPTNNQECINYFPSAVSQEGRGAVTLLPTSGSRYLANAGNTDNPIRFMKTINNIVYFVAGNTFNSLTVSVDGKTANINFIGTLNTSSGTVTGTNNPNQIILLDGLYGYIYNYIFAGSVALGSIGGAASDTYTLTINGTAVYTNQDVAVGLKPETLVSAINVLPATGVIASYAGGILTLTARSGITTIVVTESGTGFTAGVDGITVTPGVFATSLPFVQFQQITDVDFMGGSHVVYIDGYFIYNEKNSQRFWFSQPNEGRVWDPLDVAQAASKPDYLVALGETKGELWCFGSESIEVWYDAANQVGAPFSKRVGSDIDIGCGAPYSVTNVNDLLVWVDSRGFVVQSDVSPLFRNQSSGYTLTKISDEDLDAELSTYSSLANAIGSTYVDRGHTMYEITFPSANKTWVYDFNTSTWHQHSTYDRSLSRLSSSLAQYYVTINNRTICGGFKNGNIYVFDSEYYKDDDQFITRVFSTYPIQQDFKQQGIDELELKLDTGHSDIGAGYNDEQQIMLKFSNDSGYSWSNELMRPIGRRGQYNKRIIWRMLGTYNQWQFMFKMTAPIKHSIVDLTITTNVES